MRALFSPSTRPPYLVPHRAGEFVRRCFRAQSVVQNLLVFSVWCWRVNNALPVVSLRPMVAINCRAAAQRRVNITGAGRLKVNSRGVQPNAYSRCAHCLQCRMRCTPGMVAKRATDVVCEVTAIEARVRIR